MSLSVVKSALASKSNPEKAKLLSRYFKTGKGQYGEGDIFIGVTVLDIRIIAKQNRDLNLSEIKKLITSKIHEHRMTALLILVHKFEHVRTGRDLFEKKEIYDFYLKNTKYINNWDLVDLSAPKIVGGYLLNKKEERKFLFNLAKSKDLWERRIAILSCFTFIKNNEFEEASKISEILLNDEHDLIHKAVGWMLREIGKKDQKKEEEFLKKYYKKMPRTMLRYSIEKFKDKEKWMKK